MPDLVLGLDTSGASASLGLLDGEGRGVERSLPAGARQETGLGEALRALLEEMGGSAGDISLVAVGLGPGSFTGVRIGVTFAKVLAFGRPAPLHGFSSLLPLAVDAVSGGNTVAVLRRARLGRAYGAVFDLSAEPPRTISEPVLVDPRVFLAGLSAGTSVVSDDGGELDEMFRSAGVQRFPAPESVSGLTLARLGRGAHAAGRAPDDPLALLPIYGQASAPER